jgi:hypothetical protein
MELSDYVELVVGTYEYCGPGKTAYRITILSGTGMVLLFRDWAYLDACVVASDEVFNSFLALHNFPLLKLG